MLILLLPTQQERGSTNCGRVEQTDTLRVEVPRGPLPLALPTPTLRYPCFLDAPNPIRLMQGTQKGSERKGKVLVGLGYLNG